MIGEARFGAHESEEFVQDPTHLFDVLVAELSVPEMFEVASDSFCKCQMMNLVD